VEEEIFCNRKGENWRTSFLEMELVLARAEEPNQVTASPVTDETSLGWRVVKFGWLTQPPETLAAFIYVIISLFALATMVMAAFAIVASFRFAYESLVGDFKDRVEVAKVFFPVLVTLIGGPLLIWRVITAHWSAQAARQQAQTAREAHYTDLFTKAIEQLGATREVKETKESLEVPGVKREPVTRTEANLEMRLGAIYALERIAKDSERDQMTIINVVSAYARSEQNTGARKVLPNEWWKTKDGYNLWVNSIPRLRPDVQAAMTFLGEVDRITDDMEFLQKARLDLSNANLQNADLRQMSYRHSSMHNVDFSLAFLLDTSFEFADLSYANFRSATLAGAKFRGANLIGADLSAAIDLLPEQVAVALGDITTRLPKDMPRPSHWPNRELSWHEGRDWYFDVRFGRVMPTTPPKLSSG
jgi:Pentapeptide repeats (8 copies)